MAESVTIERLLTLIQATEDLCKTSGPDQPETGTFLSILHRLKSEVANNDDIIPFVDSLSDVRIWNEEINHLKAERGGSKLKLDETASPWAESYIIRKLASLCRGENISEEDLIGIKSESFLTSHYRLLSKISMHLVTSLDADDEGDEAKGNGFLGAVGDALQFCAWARCLADKFSSQQEVGGIKEELAILRRHLLANEATKVLDFLKQGEDGTVKEEKVAESSGRSLRRVDIVVGGVGIELFLDLCLADLVLAAGLANSVTFHLSAVPEVVSMATETDLRTMVKALMAVNHIGLSQCHGRWKKRLQDGSWQLRSDVYWTLPFSYLDMASGAPELYQQLTTSRLVIFRGDQHYRKLVGAAENVSNYAKLSGIPREVLPAPICVLCQFKSQAGASGEELNPSTKATIDFYP
ncbi:damage-control phosphatase ARMT1 [Aplysia californica]|uniref:Sugar phosphate phosphatase n=1 Tax=Aplysia californica TaxID=6500 RepID=A0ABM0JVZ1_APLCA|nr:damage-control phosphatase ARMT1 [Aplysia californica]